MCGPYVNPFLNISSASPLPPSPTTQQPALRREPRESRAKTLLPVYPLNIKVGANQPRGTKRSAAIAAHIDEPDRDNSEDSWLGLRKVVTSARRRVRFPSPLESRPTKRRQVVNDLETTKVATNESWVAVGDVSPLQ